MYSAGTKSKMYSNYISTSNVCWFKFSAQSSSIKTIGIEINLLENATAEVYYEYSTNKFEYKGTATLSNSVNVSVSYSYSVWVLATPTQNNGVIIAYANAYTDSSSSFSIDVNKTLVIVWSIILWFFIIAVPTALISMKCINNWKKVLNERDRQRNQERAAVLNNLPQINEGELSDHL